MKMMEMHRFSIQDQDLSHSGMIAGVRNNGVIGDDLLVPRSLLVSKSGILKSQLVKEVDTDLLQPEAQYSAPKPPPFKFHTTGAGGRSFSVQGVFLVTQT
uniref:Uncharacterized protein n=4 Tax=Populus trichocarpa TaxID=3694 RepID=A0A3N7G3B6_POPTR